ncbi:neutral zinc metallopeptidase [Sphaerimonospora cavernae]|uniref:Neutral zinc metallopeptidase n=1 Tax=Sphaerimonospora cavernae TaxID=1740611 RepID=A0ABV6U523_9ACTN
MPETLRLSARRRRPTTIRTGLRPIVAAVTAAVAAFSLSAPAEAAARSTVQSSAQSTTQSTARSAAHSAARGNALIGNPLYKTGEFDFPDCKELSRSPDDLDSYRVYLDHLLDCLNVSWTEEFRQARLPFSPPKVRYITRGVKTGCGTYPANYAAGMYCLLDKTMWIMVSKYQLADPNEFNLFTVIAHEYGHYAQDRAGVFTAANRQLRRASKRQVYAMTRRIELQAECFSGAFIGSVWSSLGRDQLDFDKQLDWIMGDKLHGTTKNIRYWLKRGWLANGPHACNTFSAPASRVT